MPALLIFHTVSNVETAPTFSCNPLFSQTNDWQFLSLEIFLTWSDFAVHVSNIIAWINPCVTSATENFRSFFLVY